MGLVQEISTLLNGLIKVQDVYSDKMIMALDKKVCDIMDAEDYKLLVAESTEDLYRFVDKFEFDITPHLEALNPSQEPPTFGRFPTQHPVVKYPLTLPFSQSVITLAETVSGLLDQCLAYW
jgi:hypothetical protein